MKEQNKPEMVIGNPEILKLNIQADKYSKAFGFIENLENELYFAFKQGAVYQKTQMYTAEDCAKMLEALRQRCAEESAKRPLQSQRTISEIDVHQFIPPLTKQ